MLYYFRWIVGFMVLILVRHSFGQPGVLRLSRLHPNVCKTWGLPKLPIHPLHRGSECRPPQRVDIISLRTVWLAYSAKSGNKAETKAKSWKTPKRTVELRGTAPLLILLCGFNRMRDCWDQYFCRVKWQSGMWSKCRLVASLNVINTNSTLYIKT